MQMQEAADSAEDPCGLRFIVNRFYRDASCNEYDRTEFGPLSASCKPFARRSSSDWRFACAGSFAHAGSMHNRVLSSPERMVTAGSGRRAGVVGRLVAVWCQPARDRPNLPGLTCQTAKTCLRIDRRGVSGLSARVSAYPSCPGPSEGRK